MGGVDDPLLDALRSILDRQQHASPMRWRAIKVVVENARTPLGRGINVAVEQIIYGQQRVLQLRSFKKKYQPAVAYGVPIGAGPAGQQAWSLAGPASPLPCAPCLVADAGRSSQPSAKTKILVKQRSRTKDMGVSDRRLRPRAA